MDRILHDERKTVGTLFLPIRQTIARAAGAFLVVLLLPASASAGQITLAWDPSPGSVAGYVIYYGVSPGSYTSQIDVGAKTSHSIPGLTNGLAYYFTVRAYTANRVYSNPSNEVSGLPGSTLRFTDDPLLPGVHAMKAVHLTELRARVDELRVARNTTAYSWATAIAPGTWIRAQHVLELRDAIYLEYDARTLPRPQYVQAPAAGTTVKAQHITQLRAFVDALFEAE